jgi:pSer/pThr/pTyr-binding forkhead associated (FHA) protein
MAVYLVPLNEGRPIVLDKAVVFIGRHPDCDVVLKDSRKVSRKHCCLAQVDDKIMVRDLGSMNGMRLNGKRIVREAAVRIGDKLTIGDVTYVLRAGQNSAQGSGQVSESRQAAENQRGQTGRADSEKGRPRPDAALIQPADSVDLSQAYPVPIPEHHRSEHRRSPDDDFTAASDSDEIEFDSDDD